ncbi:hypothetical protein AB0H83_51330 [Dactylosporangium sp. NPDC050688]|uniref:hypothetical protein n=1 Tax=Dactylosporangium sp. NPDC050688 TaxID=3157217 RepID=UPI0033C8C67D
MVRSIFVFPAGDRAETVGLLDRHLPQQRHPWLCNGAVYLEIADGESGHLYSDWTPADLAALDAATGQRPNWAVQIDVSGRIDGTEDVVHLMTLLLSRGGVAFDDYTAHAWTLPEIQSEAQVDGLRFFDFRGYHKTWDEQGSNG